MRGGSGGDSGDRREGSGVVTEEGGLIQEKEGGSVDMGRIQERGRKEGGG